jgi:hypothetical protein
MAQQTPLEKRMRRAFVSEIAECETGNFHEIGDPSRRHAGK